MSRKNSDYYLGVARKHGLTVKEGGCHTKIYAPGETRPMTIPRHRDLSPGVEHCIVKWFLKLGIAVTLVGALLAMIAR